MAQITLRIIGDATKANATIQQLEGSLKKLQGEAGSFKVIVDTKDAEAATNKFSTKFSAWAKNFQSTMNSRISSAIIGTVTNSTKQALNTMREVDQQLTNIQKVSDISADSLKKLGDEAYKTASKYGVAADKYLSAVYTFQKAGLNDNAAELAELATKTMLVGDTTADVASKFLISANAAWKLNGNIKELNKVVDEADYINNNYATDLAKLSQGFPIVASTAANLGMTVEETMAVLGTITSVTQETGSKAATAWRALAMNITGELGTFLTEDGDEIEVTAESIKAVSDALAQYAPEVVKAAKATGQIINPLEAVKALAQAYKDEKLTDIELQNILQNVGGKLRTNQLTALVKNFGMFEKMLGELGGAAGTADKEIGTMLGSWESKTQILKNTWTDFVAGLINSDTVKNGLGTLTNIINGLDSDTGRFVVTVGALGTALMALGPTGGAIAAVVAASGWLIDKVEKSNKVIKEAEQGLRNLNNAYEESDATLLKTNLNIKATAAVGQKYVQHLKELRENGIKTDEQARDYHNTLVRLKEIMPELADMIDTENDAIRGGIPALEERMNAWIEEARVAAQAAAVMAKATALANAEVASAENQAKIQQKNEELDETITKYKELQGALDEFRRAHSHYDELLGGDIFEEGDLNEEDLKTYTELATQVIQLTTAESTLKKEIGKLTEEQTKYDDAIKTATEDLELEQKALLGLQGEEANEPDPLTSSKKKHDELVKRWQKVHSIQQQIAKEEAEIVEKTSATADAADEAAKNYQDMADSMQAALGDHDVGRGDDETRLNNAVASASTSFSKNRMAFDDHNKKIQETSEEIIATTEGLLEDEANVFETESGAAVSAARAAGASMGKAVGMGIVDQAPFVKDAIARLLDMSRQFVGSLFASGNMSYGHGSGFTLVGAGGNNYDAFMKAWRQGQNAGRTDTVRFGSASGTSNAPGGATLVNELGPELINDNGRVFIANGGKPAVVNLSRGAIVLTAEDTKEALRGSGTVPKRGAAQAMTGAGDVIGGGSSTRVRLDPYRPSGPMVSWSQTSQPGKPTGYGGGNGKPLEEAAESMEDLAQKLTDLLGILDLQAELANNEERYSDEGDIYGKAVDAIGDMLQAYRDAGYAEDSKEILELLNQQYDYQDKQAKAYQMVWDTLEKSLSETNKNLEAQAEIAKNAGDYQKQGDLYGQALDNIHELLAQYRDAGYAEDSDEILSLLKQGNDYADKQRAAYQAAWDTLETNLSTVQKNLDLQVQLAEDAGDYGKQIELYGKQIENAQGLLEQYRQAGFAEDSDEVLTLLKQINDYEGKREAVEQSRWNALESNLSGVLKNLDLQAELAEKNGDYGKQAELYGQAIASAEGLLAEYRSAGYAEDSDEILTLLRQIGDYQDKRTAAENARWSNLESGLSSTLSLLDMQANLAEKAGDYAKQGELYGKAIKANQEVLAQYREAGYGEDSKEILTILQKINDYEDKQEALAQARWTNLENGLSDVLKNLDLQAEQAQDAQDYAKEGGVYGKAIESIDALLAEYRSAGYGEDSNEILTLMRQRRDYEQKREAAAQARWDDLESNLSETLSLLDMQAGMAEKAGDYDKAGGLYGQAIRENQKLLEQYRRAGYAENSKEILTLLQEIGDYEDRQESAYQGRWDELEGNLADVLRVLDLQADLAQGAGNYDRAGGLYGQAQAAIKELLQQYLDAGYGENSEEVLTLRKQLEDYQGREADAYQGHWDELESNLSDVLKKLDLQSSLAESNGDYAGLARLYEKAQEAIADLTRKYQGAGFADDSIEVLTLLKQNNDYADRQLALYQERWDELVDSLDVQTEALDTANQLAEKQEKIEEARLALENAQKQRTVRIFNGETNQWEWIADQAKVKSAEEALASTEEEYAEDVKSKALEELRAMRDTITDLNDVVLGPALSAVATMAENSAEFQAFAKALDAVFGVGSFLQSTAGSEKVLPGSDSHDTVYSFGDIKLTEEQAGSLTLKQLAEQLRVLKII